MYMLYKIGTCCRKLVHHLKVDVKTYTCVLHSSDRMCTLLSQSVELCAQMCTRSLFNMHKSAHIGVFNMHKCAHVCVYLTCTNVHAWAYLTCINVQCCTYGQINVRIRTLPCITVSATALTASKWTLWCMSVCVICVCVCLFVCDMSVPTGKVKNSVRTWVRS